MIRRPPISTRTDILFPYTTLFRSVLAMHAIWDSWMTGAKLDFHGDFYTHTLITPFFNPGPHDYGHPRVFLAGVGPRMTEVAGEVCDGFFCHGFTTEKYLREVTRSEEHTSELQSLMRISYAVFCLKKKTYKHNKQHISRQRHASNPHTTTINYAS